MTKSGLPIAKELTIAYKIGDVSVKTKKPTESRASVKKTIDILKDTANKDIFVQNGKYFI